MGKDEKPLAISGGVTISLAIIGTGFKLAFPDMIVPLGWALALMGLGAASLLLTLYFAYVWYWRRSASGDATVRRPDDFEQRPHSPRERPERATDQLLEEVERATRWAWATHRPPVETSHPRVIAEAKAMVRELDGKLGYVERVLEENDAADLRKWRMKIDSQRVPFGDLNNDPLASMSASEREHVRLAVRALSELDRTIDMVVAEPRKFKAAHCAGMYRHRAEKSRRLLQKLIALMESESD